MIDSRIVNATTESIRSAAALLKQGLLVGVPTETVYGLAADGTNADAVAKIYRAKGRPANNPLILHFDAPTSALTWLRIDPESDLGRRWQTACWFWPGPLTVVAPHNGRVPDAVTSGAETVAVRIPKHPVMQQLLRVFDRPIAAPSANRSNYVSPTTALHVASAFDDQVAMILDGGPCRCGIESTIIRLDQDPIQILRPGGISAECLQQRFGRVSCPTAAVEDATQSSASASLPSPGLLAKHYSPTKTLCIGADWNPQSMPPSLVARITFAPIDSTQANEFGWYRCLSQRGDLEEVARNLYTALRDADQTDCRWIVIDRCDRQGIGLAIMDRIDRASR